MESGIWNKLMTSVRCPECNLANWAESINCKRCNCFLPPVEGAPAEFFGGERENPQVHQTNPQSFQTSEFQSENAPDWSQTPPPNYQSGGQSTNRQSHQAGYGQNYSGYRQSNYASAPSQKSGMAIASMVIGLIGCFFASPIGLILGIVSLKRANKRPFEFGGKGFAIAGIVLNSLGIFTLPIIAAIAIPNLLAARRAANEGGAISVVRQLSAAEQNYRASSGGGRCGDLPSLLAARLIDSTVASGQKNGYRFMVVNLPTVGGGCEINATPLTDSHGTRSFFYSTEDNTIRAAKRNGRFAEQTDAPLGQETSFSENSEKRNVGGGFVAAYEAADELKTLSNLRLIVAAETTYIATVGQGKCGTLQSLAAAQLMGSDLASGEKNGYRLQVNSLPPPQSGCEVRATPISAGGSRSFYAGNDGVIRGANKDGNMANKNDPPIY